MTHGSSTSALLFLCGSDEYFTGTTSAYLFNGLKPSETSGTVPGIICDTHKNGKRL